MSWWRFWQKAEGDRAATEPPGQDRAATPSVAPSRRQGGAPEFDLIFWPVDGLAKIFVTIGRQDPRVQRGSETTSTNAGNFFSLTNRSARSSAGRKSAVRLIGPSA